jgi:hypothetical protein
MPHTTSWNSSSGHTAVPLELRNSSEVHLLLTPPASDCPQMTFAVPHIFSAQTYRKHVTWSLSTVVWYHCLRRSVFTEPLPRNGLHTMLFYCCMHVMQDVYRAVAWQCIHMSQYTFHGRYGPYHCSLRMNTNMQNKQSWTADSGWYSSLEARHIVNNPSLQNVLQYKGLIWNYRI